MHHLCSRQSLVAFAVLDLTQQRTNQNQISITPTLLSRIQATTFITHPGHNFYHASRQQLLSRIQANASRQQLWSRTQANASRQQSRNQATTFITHSGQQRWHAFCQLQSSVLFKPSNRTAIRIHRYVYYTHTSQTLYLNRYSKILVVLNVFTIYRQTISQTSSSASRLFKAHEAHGTLTASG